MALGSKESFSPQYLFRVLSTLPSTKRYLVAYSGGSDSHALLQSLTDLMQVLSGVSVCAIHVNHGLTSAAGDWEAHCGEVCRRLNVSYRAVRVTVDQSRGDSIEAAARRVRYDALARHMSPGDMVLTAHTQDDQAETLLLQLLRGSGVDGLASMPGHVEFANGWLGRPLLQISRTALRDYSSSLALDSIEDPSNQDRRLARNYLRREVLPALRRRWPSVGKTLARSAFHLAQTSQLTKDLADIDLEVARNTDTNTLYLPGLMSLSLRRRRNAIRGWIRDRGIAIPSTAQLEQIVNNVLEATPSAAPMVAFGDMIVRRYGNDLYLLPREESPEQASFCWELTTRRVLVGGELSANLKLGQGIAVSRVPLNQVRVQFRRGGERCRPRGHAHHKTLKHLFQQHRIPPWERGVIPLIYIGNELAAVAGLWVSETFASREQEMGWVVEWHVRRQES